MAERLISIVVKIEGATASLERRSISPEGFTTKNGPRGRPDNLRQIARGFSRSKHVAYGELDLTKIAEFKAAVSKRERPGN